MPMTPVAETLIALEARYGAHNYHPLDVVIHRAEGVWVWDVEGRKYLDFLAAYSAVNQGHCHPVILQALLDQARAVTLTWVRRAVVKPVRAKEMAYGPGGSEANR